jgi:hypothetical protein
VTNKKIEGIFHTEAQAPVPYFPDELNAPKLWQQLAQVFFVQRPGDRQGTTRGLHGVMLLPGLPLIGIRDPVLPPFHQLEAPVILQAVSSKRSILTPVEGNNSSAVHSRTCWLVITCRNDVQDNWISKER